MISFKATGIPKPQGSKRAFVVNGRPVLTESAGVALRDWRAIVAHEAALTMGDRSPLEGPLSVVLTFLMPRPKRLPKGRPAWPATRPDIDKLARSVLDSCSGITYRDDGQIVALTVRKLYVNAAPGVHVTVESCGG